MTLIIAILIIAGTGLSWGWLGLVIPAWIIHIAWQANCVDQTVEKTVRKMQFDLDLREGCANARQAFKRKA